VLLLVCLSLLAHHQYKLRRLRARWRSLVALQLLWGDNQTGCCQFWLGIILLLDMIIGQVRVGQAILISACIIDLRARPYRWPALHRKTEAHFFSFQAISWFC
jgi:hypothetical protein